jgi:UDP-N-acetylmuramoylalanine--D-glutamate ligase
MRTDVAPLSPTLRAPHLEGLRVVVIGLGRSGLAAARLAASKGARVIAADRRSEADLAAAVEEARAAGAEVRCGGHGLELLEGTDLVVVSPGVPPDVPVVAEARRRQIPVWGEIELAWRYCRGRVLGITGSNGKSTVTSMAGTILRASGIPGGTGGNLGAPLTELLADDATDAVHAVELSSFQLETTDSFHADGAVVVNLAPDHLDRYDSFDAYVAAKARLLEGQEPDGFAILNEDDPETGRLMPAVRAELYRFSTQAPVERGAWIHDGILSLSLGGREEAILAADDLPVRGEHNHANALAAALACRLLGAPPDAVARGLRAYRALPHRLERVGSVAGVEFFDDSKATNLDAAIRAIRSFEPGTVHLILGGRDKGADWAALTEEVLGHVRRVLLVGEAAPAIRRGLADAAEIEDCGTVEAAVRAGFEKARRGDVVLLSPGCASFDQYRNFEERGDDFKTAVVTLARVGGDDA